MRLGAWSLATSLVIAALSGCDINPTMVPTKSLTYTEDARRAYEEAMESFRSKDWETARPLLQEVRKLFPQSRYARLAELRLADIEFATERYVEAVTAYRAFASTYRTDKEVEYARYRLSKALYFDISDTFIQPPAEEREQATTIDAYRELRSFERAFPRSRYQRDIAYMLEMVTGRLVRHELYVARYYRRLDNFEAAIARIDYALKSYPNSGLDAEALVLKGETLMMMNRRQEARLAFQSVVDDWGGAFLETAKAFLAELSTPTQEPPSIRRPPDPGLPPPPSPAQGIPAQGSGGRATIPATAPRVPSGASSPATAPAPASPPSLPRPAPIEPSGI
jgi:outer membrane protein assembly factor BamD